MSNAAVTSRTVPVPITPKFPAGATETAVLLASPSRQRESPFRADSPDSVQSGRLSRRSSCETCQRTGTKCAMSDGETSCAPCQASGSECSLVQSPQPRKRKLNNGDAAEESDGRRSPPRLLEKRQQNPSLSSTAASTSFLEDPHMANVGRPTQLKRTLGLQHDRYSQYIGPTTDFEPSLINLSPFDPQDESLLARGTLRKVGEHDTFLLLPDHATPGHDRIARDADEIESLVAPHGRRLVDLYFGVVHPAFPIIQKTVFLEKYERSYREFSPALLAAVYLLAINWWDHCDDLARLSRPNVRELERLVRTTLADAMFRPKLSTVQAGLLLSQRPGGDQWAPTAQLVAIGQELGLHLDCAAWKIPPWEKGLRKRLAWALFMQDKWGALVHGRPSHIFSPNWAVAPLSSADFPHVESDEHDDGVETNAAIEKGRVIFQQMVQLSEILAEILETFYTLAATRSVPDGAPGVRHILGLAKPIQLRLKEWQAHLPSSVRLDSSSALAARCCDGGYLHLAYYSAEITLHRCIIRALSSAVELAAGSVDPNLEDVCRSAAKARLISAMDFVNRLMPSHLRAFWYFASKTNFALIGTFGSLLWAVSPTREEADWYRRRLGEYRWTLSVNCKPGTGAGDGNGNGNSNSNSNGGNNGNDNGDGDGNKRLTEFAMGMLDISTGLLKKLPEKPEMSVSRVGSSTDMGGVAGAGLGRLSELQAGFTGILTSRPLTPPSMSEDESSDEDMYEDLTPAKG